MSNNSKNIIREEHLKNFTKNILSRIIITSKEDIDLRWIDTQMMGNINHQLNKILQDINLKTPTRQIPYMTLCVQHKSKIEPQSRIIIRNFETSPVFENDIKSQMESSTLLTHLIDILVADGYQDLRDSELSGTGLTLDPINIEGAIIDIALDIAMFNSYSFLRDMTPEQKRTASKQKYTFYQTHDTPSFYACTPLSLDYFSLAFLARKTNKDFDVDSYIRYWNNFIAYYYPNQKHIEQSLKEQIKQHVDIEELPKTVNRKFTNLPPGSYLLLRTNTDRTENLHPKIFTLFGITRYRKGHIKVIPISAYNTHKPIFENLDVSAFKVVIS